MSAYLNKLHAGAGHQTSDVAQAPHATEDPEVQVATDTGSPNNGTGAGYTEDKSATKVEEELVPAQDAQRGVQKIEAVTLAWTKWSLAALLFKYVCPFLPFEFEDDAERSNMTIQ